MKKSILLIVVSFIISNFAGAQQTTPPVTEKPKEVKVTLDLSFMNPYVSKGTQPYGNKGAWFETAYLDLWQTGFGLGVGHQSASSDNSQKERYNYNVNYTNSLFNDEIYKTVYRVDWIYKDYYGRASRIGDTQNFILDFSWPNLLPVKNLSPYYIADYETPAGSHFQNSNIAGWVHRFGLSYKLPVRDWAYPLNFTSEIAYNDGFGANVDHDWAYSTFGVASKFNINEKLSFIPGIYYQITMDESVNSNKDVTYAKLSLRYAF
jgi:hypothetical protein